MMVNHPRILFVTEREEDVRSLRGVVQKINTAARVDVADGISAVPTLAESNFSLIILDVDFQGGVDLGLLKGLHHSAPRVPVLLLVAPIEGAHFLRGIREGLDSYVAREEIDTDRFEMAIRSSLARRPESDRPKFGPDRWSPALEKKEDPLSQSDRAAFSDLVARYTHLLEHSLDRQTYKGEDPTASESESLARMLRAIGASARDVVEIHTCALKQKYDPATPKKYLAYAKEGRLVLLELMGYLVGHYRHMALGEFALPAAYDSEKAVERG